MGLNAIIEKDENDDKCSCKFQHRNKKKKPKYVIDLQLNSAKGTLIQTKLTLRITSIVILELSNFFQGKESQSQRNTSVKIYSGLAS